MVADPPRRGASVDARFPNAATPAAPGISGPPGGSRRAPEPSGAAPEDRGWMRENPVLTTVLVALLLVLGFLALTYQWDRDGIHAGAEAHHVWVQDHLWWHGHGHDTVVVLDHTEYVAYLHHTIRPTLQTISVSYTNAACGAEHADADEASQAMLQAYVAANDTLKVHVAVEPPAELAALHAGLTEVLQGTVASTQSTISCIETDSDCELAASQTAALLHDMADLADEVGAVVDAGVLA